jgi:hypothetical protein
VRSCLKVKPINAKHMVVEDVVLWMAVRRVLVTIVISVLHMEVEDVVLWMAVRKVL